MVKMVTLEYEEKKIIIPAIKKLKKKYPSESVLLSPDTSFLQRAKLKD